jgi:hypothetical protein
MCRAIEADCIAGSGKLLRSGFADRAKEGHEPWLDSSDPGRAL